jgi:hypothetical protein
MARADFSSVLLVLFTVLTTDLRAQGLDTTDYVPLRVGNTYTYYQSLPCPPDTVERRIGPWTTHRIVDTTIIEGKKYFISEGSSDMVRIDSVNNVIVRRSNVEQVYYRLNAGVGESWSYTETAGGQEYVYNVTMQSRTDTVRVHAGTFGRCLRIYFDIPRSIDDEYTVWLAPNVGAVFQCRWEPLELYEATIGGIHYPIVTNVEMEASPTQLFTLYQNYPNPFNPSTTIQFQLPTRSIVRFEIFDLMGQKVAVLASGVYDAGNQQVVWKPQVATGIYFYRIAATSLSDPTNHFVSTKNLMILR